MYSVLTQITLQGESDSEDSKDQSDSDEELFDNTGVKERDIPSGKVSDASDDDDDSHIISPTPPKKTAAPKPKRPVAFNSDSDDEKPNGNGNGIAALNGDSDSEEEKKKKKKPAAKKPAPKKLKSSDDLFDSMMSNGDKKPAPAPKKKAAKKKFDFDDDSGSDLETKPKKKAPAKKAAAKKTKFDSDGSESDFNMEDVAPARDRPGKRTGQFGIISNIIIIVVQVAVRRLSTMEPWLAATATVTLFKNTKQSKTSLEVQSSASRMI